MILSGIPLTNHENSTKNIGLPWVLKTWNDCRSSECQDLLSQFSLKTVQIIVSFYLNSSGSEIILIINCLACICRSNCKSISSHLHFSLCLHCSLLSICIKKNLRSQPLVIYLGSLCRLCSLS